MLHNQIQQVQQKLNTVQQMLSHARQSEQQNQQRLQQLSQEEGNMVQQMQRIQNICQECMSNLQNVIYSQQPTVSSVSQSPNYTGAGKTYSQQQFTAATQPQLFDPTTMSPDTYQNTMQTMGGISSQTMGGISSFQGRQQFQQPGYIGGGVGTGGQVSSIPTQTSLSDISTMGPDTYLASRQQLGSPSQDLSQIGQQAGISGSGMNIGSHGQQSGISTMTRGLNQ